MPLRQDKDSTDLRVRPKTNVHTDSEVFVARQPILDRSQRLCAYELLFRASRTATGSHCSGDEATLRVLNASLLVLGLPGLTKGQKAFINITRDLLLDGVCKMLPSHQVVLEILEDVHPDDDVVAACQELKEAGYSIALDDYVDTPEMNRLLALAEIVKVDFCLTAPEERRRLAESMTSRGIRLLAEKVETREEHEEARELGYAYFQGYFFCRPQTVAGREIPMVKVNHLRLLRELYRPDMDYGDMADVVRTDVALSVKLFRWVNSYCVEMPNTISSPRRALAQVGELALRKWGSLITAVGMCEDKPPELLSMCLVRARLCELIAPEAGLTRQSSDLFLIGLLSMVDAIVDRPLEQVLREISASSEITSALLEPAASPLGCVYGLVRCYERGDWNGVDERAGKLDVPVERLPELYLQAVHWTRRYYQV